MALAEKIIKERLDDSPDHYARRVRWMAVIYLVLNVVSIAIIVTIVWRARFFVTLAQRSNIETLTLAIILVLALYYVVTTFRGFIGGLRMAWLNLPALRTKDKDGKWKLEHRKHVALPMGGPKKYVCFDKAVRLENKPDEAIVWDVGDDAGKLGEIVLDGVKATYHPMKDGMNDSLFEFLANCIQNTMQKRDLDAELSISQWSTIDEDQASTFFNMVEAFGNLEARLQGKGFLWPTVELSQEEVDAIGESLRELVPALRNESLLPNVEYEVEYNVPVLPEPLGFVKLTRKENRADPFMTMGCASMVMLLVMVLLTIVIVLPPWVPSR